MTSATAPCCTTHPAPVHDPEAAVPNALLEHQLLEVVHVAAAAAALAHLLLQHLGAPQGRARCCRAPKCNDGGVLGEAVVSVGGNGFSQFHFLE